MPEMPIRPMSTLNWRMKSIVASPTMPRSRERTMPPATITSQSGLSERIAATFRLLVITRSPWWCSSSWAIASVVVPMLMTSEHPTAPPRATARGDALLRLAVEVLALAVGDVLGGRARQAHAAVEARQEARVGEQLDVAPHRLQRHAELFGERLDRDRAARAHLVEQQGLARVRGHRDADSAGAQSAG